MENISTNGNVKVLNLSARYNVQLELLVDVAGGGLRQVTAVDRQATATEAAGPRPRGHAAGLLGGA